MKKLLYLLLFVPVALFGQQNLSLELPQGWSMFGYVSSENINVEDAFFEISDKVEIVKDELGSAYLPSWEFNAIGELKFSEGYQIKMTEQVDDFQFFTVITADLDSILNAIQFDINQNELVSDASDSILLSYIELLIYHIDSLENTLDVVSMYFGCKDHDACNYNPNATMSDNSCTYADEGYYCNGECIDTDTDGICDLDEVEGCTDATACNYVLGATNEDGSCQYNEEYYNCQGICANDDDGDGTCDELEEGCTDETADNYNPQTLNSTNCIYIGCMDNNAGNFNPIATQDDGSCITAEACPYPEYLEYVSTAESFNEALCLTWAVYGCMDNTALNYNSQANSDDGTCQYIYGCSDQEANNYNAEATTDDGSCIYYGCMDPTAGNYNESANTDDGTCLIGGCMNVTAENYSVDASIDDGSCIIYGCTLSSFPNYNSLATVGDGSCDMNSLDVFGCTDESTITYEIEATIDNGTCYYGPLPEIGDLLLGGIVFYIDETGQDGLIAAIEDIGQLPWGCYLQTVEGAGGIIVGSGYQNTINIASQGCGGAAQAALNYEQQVYDDWYLPSFYELELMYNSIGPGAPQGNLGGFSSSPSGGYDEDFYWSSTTGSPNSMTSRVIDFKDGSLDNHFRDFYARVRVIRAF